VLFKPITDMDIARERQRVAGLTAQCKRVEYFWDAPHDTQWVAELWCNDIGECVLGYGPDVWAAVQAAHALAEIAAGRGTSCIIT
jgi:hypothetical protein